MKMLKLLRKSEALLEGHFLLSSGLHSDRYAQCAQLLQYPKLAAKAAKKLAKEAPKGAELVVSPAMGGLFVGHEVARALGLRHIFTERDNGTMVLRRGFKIAKGEKVVVVEDVFTTGKSTREVIDLVKAHGGKFLGALSLVNRSNESLGFPARSLIKLNIRSWEPEDCPLCAKGMAVIKPGSRPVQAPPLTPPRERVGE